MIVPISKKVIEPIIQTNIDYVDTIEEFEKIELQPNETKLCFDNNQSCFYIKGRNAKGEYSPVKIYFYEDFAQKIRDIEREEFEKKCREVGLDEVKVECACRFFLDNQKPYDVWLWVTSEKGKNWSWDYVIALKCSFKKKLFKQII